MPKKHSSKNKVSLTKLEKKAFPDHPVSLIKLREFAYAEKLGEPISEVVNLHIKECSFCQQQLALLRQSNPNLIKNIDEQWNSVQGYSGNKCHICPMDTLVRSGPLNFAGQTFQWSLCDICNGKGWQVPTVSLRGNVYGLVYKNTKTEETAWVDVLEIIKIIPPRPSR